MSVSFSSFLSVVSLHKVLGLQHCQTSTTASLLKCCWNLLLLVLDEEAGSGRDPCQAVEKLLSVILKNKALNPSDCDCDKRSSWVHCGKTKVFLTQLMVSIQVHLFSYSYI